MASILGLFLFHFLRGPWFLKGNTPCQALASVLAPWGNRQVRRNPPVTGEAAGKSQSPAWFLELLRLRHLVPNYPADVSSTRKIQETVTREAGCLLCNTCSVLLVLGAKRLIKLKSQRFEQMPRLPQRFAFPRAPWRWAVQCIYLGSFLTENQRKENKVWLIFL